MRTGDVPCAVPGYAAVQCTDDATQLSFRVLVAGTGPAVIVMHEMLGAGPAYLDLAYTLRSKGYRTWLPIFFEPAGRDIGGLRGLARVCIRRELRTLALGRRTPLADWLRGLVEHVTTDDRDGSAAGRVAVIGMCMTGGLVFGLLLHRDVSAAVAAQPALPFVRTLPAEARALGDARRRGSDAPVPLLTLRFADDRLSSRCRADRARASATTQPCRAADADPPLEARQCGLVRAVEAPGRHHATLTYDATAAGGAMISELIAFLTAHHPTGAEADGR